MLYVIILRDSTSIPSFKGGNWGSEKLITFLWSHSSWQSWAVNLGITDSGPEHLTTGSDKMRNTQWHYRHNTHAGKVIHPKTYAALFLLSQVAECPPLPWAPPPTLWLPGVATLARVDSVPESPTVSIPAPPASAPSTTVWMDVPTRRLVRQAWSLTPAALAVTGLKPSACGVHWGL